MKHLTRICILTIFLLSSCIQKQTNHHENLDIKSNWSNTEHSSESNIEHLDTQQNKYWWKNFNNPTIDKLVEVALENNIDSKISLARIIEARGNRSLSKSKLIPNIDISQSSNSSDAFVSLGSKTVLVFNTALDASWEIDLFNTNKYKYDSKSNLLNAAIADQKHISVTLVADIILNYTDYLKYKNLADIRKQKIELHKHHLDITQSKHISGLITDLELEEKKAKYSQIKSEIYSFDTEMKKARHRLETLCGIQAGTSNILDNNDTEIPLIPKEMVMSSPTHVIENRPDVQKSMYELLAATSMTKSAISEQYPKITLLGSIGYQDSSISPSSEAFSLGQTMLSPILNFQKIKSNINIYESKEEQAFLKYKKSMLLVIEDVESSLVSYYNAQKNHEALHTTFTHRKHALDLAKHLYESQTKPYTTVLDAEEDLLNTHSDLITSSSNLLATTTKLYKALGYGV
ncbi:MAG: TolC family protein [Alphaproteobacteria bacterium]|nr:TolC family protein [Alphaproteobacteria bacterium]